MRLSDIDLDTHDAMNLSAAILDAERDAASYRAGCVLALRAIDLALRGNVRGLMDLLDEIEAVLP